MPRNRNVGVSVRSVSTIMASHMASKKTPVNWKELVDVVEKERNDFLSKDVAATIRSILMRDKRFVRTSLGMYYLRETS